VATNQIRDVTFRSIRSDDDDAGEGGHALFIVLDVAEPTQLLGFLEDVVTRFKREHMAGPPTAKYLLITLVGEVSAGEFAQAWQAVTANDAPARALIGMLERADVMQGDAQGGVLGQASLRAA
jgi:hypothetical protein